MSDPTPPESSEPSLDEADDPKLAPIPVFVEAPADPPRHYVIDDTLVSQTRGGEVRIALYVPFRVTHLLADRSPREQLYRLLRLRGKNLRERWAGQRVVRRLENLDTTDSNDIVRRFWQAYGEREVARLGESLRSAP
jgi:hypothetical protein